MVKDKNYKKKKKENNDLNDYKGYNIGPFKIERLGQALKLSSNLGEDEFKKFQKNIIKKRPTIKNEIDGEIKEIISVLEQNDPFQILTWITLKNCCYNPEIETEITRKGKESYAEYIQSLVLGIQNKSNNKELPDGEIDRLNELIEKLYNNIIWYFIADSLNNKIKKDKIDFHYSSITHFLLVRGVSYHNHHIELIKDLFQPHDIFLKQNFNFITNDIISLLSNIQDTINNNIKTNIELFSLLNKLYEMYNTFIEEKGENYFSSLEECKAEYNSLPDVIELKKDMDLHRDKFQNNPFIINSSNKLNESLMSPLSAHFGENIEFVTFEKTKAWPTNNSIIYDKPLIEHEGKYYCFLWTVLFRNIIYIIENWIKKKDFNYFNDTYQKKRAEYLVEKSLDYFRLLLPGAELYRNLYYIINENGEKKQVETDGLIIYDNNIFIIEGKAGSVSLSTRRGGLKSIKTDVDDLINDAYKQALRTKNYIIENETPHFTDKDGKLELVIEDESKYENIFLINVTLENLDVFSTRLNSLKTFNFIQGKEWPWSVFINDLRIISELICSPSEFILYLIIVLRTNSRLNILVSAYGYTWHDHIYQLV